MEKKSTLLTHPGTFTKNIVRTPEFMQANAEADSAPGERLRRGIKLGAHALADTHERKNKAESLMYRLIGTINDFADGQAELDALRQSGAPRSEKLSHLRKVIEFNHAVKDLVNYDHGIAFNELLSFITNTYIGSHRDTTPHIKWFESAARASLDGMRHELAYERVIGEAQLIDESLEYDEETTVNDELSGVDYYIIHGSDRFGIDVKSSPRARDEAQLHSRKPHRIVWSQLHWDDFDGGFHISQTTARSKAQAVLSDLQTARLAA